MKRLILSIAIAAGVLAAQTTHDYGGRLVENGINNLGTVGGTNTYTVSPSPAVVALTQNVTYCGYFTNANTTAATLNVSSLGATAIVKLAATALVSGDIAATSSHCFTFNGTSLVIDHVDNAAAGSGDFSSNTSTSVDSEAVLFSSTAGKTGKRSKVVITPVATGSTITIADGKTVAVNNTITFAGTDSTTMTFPSASATIGQTVASGTSAMGTGAISSGACATVVTTTATGTAATDVIAYVPNADPTGVTGYAVSASGSLYIWAYPTTNNVNFKVCNNTSGSITPSALTLNWRVAR